MLLGFGLILVGGLVDAKFLALLLSAPDVALGSARTWRGVLGLMAVEVGEGFGVVGDHGIEIEGLRVGEVGVRDGNRDGGPVGTEPTAKTAGVIAGAEVVVAGFGVALLALEFVVLRACVGDGPLAAVGIEIRVVANDAVILRHDARTAEHIFYIVERVAARGQHGDALAAEEDVFRRGVAGAVGFGEDVPARPIPVELAIGFIDAAPVAVVGIINAAGRLELAFGIPGVRKRPIACGVTG